MRALQPFEERAQLAETARPGDHQVDQFVVIGEQELSLRDRLAEQPARPQRQPAALLAAGRHRRPHLGDDEL